MPPFPVSQQMDSGPGAPQASKAGPSSPLWRLADRRSRKAGAGNIFSDVNLWQLQRLFRAAGDQDAEQRAQLVWCHRDEAELAQALIGLRARGHRRGLRSNGKDVLGSHWLRAFNHLRIGESPPSSPVKDHVEEEAEEEGGPEAATHSSPEPQWHTSAGTTSRGAGAVAGLTETQGSLVTSERPVRTSSGLRRGGEGNPERYLHKILH